MWKVFHFIHCIGPYASIVLNMYIHSTHFLSFVHWISSYMRPWYLHTVLCPLYQCIHCSCIASIVLFLYNYSSAPHVGVAFFLKGCVIFTVGRRRKLFVCSLLVLLFVSYFLASTFLSDWLISE